MAPPFPSGFSFGVPGADPFSQMLSQATAQPQPAAQATPRMGGLPDRSAALSQFAGMRDIESQIGSLEPKRSALMTKMAGGPQVSGSTAMLNGVASVLPLILGMMIAKKKGGAIGGQVGAQLGASLNEKAQSDAKLGYEADKLQLDAYGDQLKSLEDRKFGLQSDAYKGGMDDQASLAKSQMDLMNDKEKILYKSQVDPEKGTTIHMPGQAAELSPDQQKRADDAAMQIDGIAATVRDIDTIIPNWREQTPVIREDGSLDIDRMVEGAAQKVSYKLFGAQTEQDIARAKIGRMLAQRLKLISGTAASDAERLNSSAYMVGDGILAPAAWPVAMYLLETEKNDQKRIYQNIHANASQGRMTGPQARNWADEIEKTAVGDRRTKLPEGLAPKLDAPKMVNTIKDGIKKTIADAPPGLDFQGLRQWKADNGIS